MNDEFVVTEVRVEEITPSAFNPRGAGDGDKFKELVASIKEKGVLQPVIIRNISKDAGVYDYEMVCGHRRHKAAIAAGLKTIPAILRRLNNEQAMECQAIENLQREDISAIDEAAGYFKILEEFKKTPKELAFQIGKTVKYIADRMELLGLPDDIKKAISENKISANHGAVIARVPDHGDRSRLFEKIIKNKLSANAAENYLKNTGNDIREASFDTAECKKCRHLGKNQGGLFDKDTDIDSVCLDGACWKKKEKESGKSKSRRGPKVEGRKMQYADVLRECVVDKIPQLSAPELEAVARLMGVAPACRVCGCTQSQGCHNGCHWVEKDLCSACVGKKKQRPANVTKRAGTVTKRHVPETKQAKPEPKVKATVTSNEPMTAEQKKAADALAGTFAGKRK